MISKGGNKKPAPSLIHHKQPYGSPGKKLTLTWSMPLINVVK
jgi:hypothetical protein